jgi:uncharacterized membrane protein
LKLGFEDFKAKPSHLLVLGLIYPLGAALAAGLVLGRDFIQLLFPAASGLALTGPAAAIIFYEISRRREEGQDFAWSEVAGIFKRVSIWGVVALGFVLIAILGLWLITAQAIYDATLGAVAYETLPEFLRLVFFTPEGWALIIFGNGAGFVFAAAVLASNVVSFPMLLDRDVGAPAAVATSLRVTAASPLTIALWGFIIAAGMIAGTLLLLVGLAVVLPVLGHASWRLYRKAVAPPG